jgi:acetyl-CoA C-acetyltransferase
MSKQPRPCIVGVAQKTWKPDQGDAPHPVVQAAEVARLAALDCGNRAILEHIDELDTVLSVSWLYDDPGTDLADLLALPPGKRRLSGLSGTSPQKFVNDAAQAILKGESRAVLIAGGEAFATRKRAAKEERQLDWPTPDGKVSLPFDRPLVTEITHKVTQAYATFAALDSARRARLGVEPEEYRRYEAAMMAGLSQIASGNPGAWFPKAHRPEDIFKVDAGNRMVSYPYTKNMMAFMDVDMAAAMIMADDDLADELGIAPEKRIYLHGWGYAEEPAAIAARAELWRCPAMETASKAALAMAGKDIGEIAHLDLYSCFASALNFAKDALGIAETDPRPLTLTGGLPYFGGPGNNYTTHAIATLVEKLRQNPGEFGLINGIGMHMTHHVFGIYGSIRPESFGVTPAALSGQSARIVDDGQDGPATIAAYTVLHDKQSVRALAICEFENGHRCYAHCTDPEVVQAMETSEWVGRKVTLLRGSNGVNLIQ